MVDFDFVWVHKAGRHNQVADALSQKKLIEFVGSLSRVVTDSLLDIVKQEAPHDIRYSKLVK